MWKKAVFNSTNLALSMAAGVVGGALGLQFSMGVYALAPALLLAAVAAAVLVWSSLSRDADIVSFEQDVAARRWVAQGATVDEVRSRQHLYDIHGASAIVAMHGLDISRPTHNLDGAPMLPGNVGLDINGRLYGAPDLVTSVHDSHTNTWHSPSDAYRSPHCMND